MLELLRRAVMPRLSLQKAIHQWKDISHQLAEAPRKRGRQCAGLEILLS